MERQRTIYVTAERAELLERAREVWPGKSDSAILFDALAESVASQTPGEPERSRRQRRDR